MVQGFVLVSCEIGFKLRGAKLGFPAKPIVARMHCPSEHQVAVPLVKHDAAERVSGCRVGFKDREL